ncbi:hypothetical protein M0804_013448 [Polistes exclamans]|nr:hypothetical protein M0804_013448 [Polistes exclamans]
MEIVKEKRKMKERGSVLLVRDWNVRTGKEGGSIDEMDCENKKVKIRQSKDEAINEEGRRLVKEITEEGRCIINGQKEKKESSHMLQEKGNL